MVKGQKITLGSVEYTLSPLSFGQIQENEELLASIKDVNVRDVFMGKGSAEAVCQLVLCALKRNHPDTPIEAVRNGLDVGNAPEALLALMGVSGFVAEKRPGEAPAGSL